MLAYVTDEQFYDAIVSRDSDADSVFFYAVLTTGVYCYPSCPSKLSLVENTRYFKTRQAAVNEGFRACKRCLSDQAPLRQRQRDLVESACRLINASSGSSKIETIAETLTVSRYHLQKLFKQFLGVSPKVYSNSVRAQRLASTLSHSESVTRAVYDAGYNQPSSFYAEGAERLGMNAKQYQGGGKGLVIRYAFGRTTFGRIIVATTLKGVCCILFGESQGAMVQDLETRFKHAKLVRDTTSLALLVTTVVREIEYPDDCSSFSLDIQGTVFQEKVWRALQNIQPGDTASYLDIAKIIGKPKASRAVAAACAANPLAVVVPCHRVVRSTGEISGYRWGVNRKRKLLVHESRDKTNK